MAHPIFNLAAILRRRQGMGVEHRDHQRFIHFRRRLGSGETWSINLTNLPLVGRSKFADGEASRKFRVGGREFSATPTLTLPTRGRGDLRPHAQGARPLPPPGQASREARLPGRVHSSKPTAAHGKGGRCTLVHVRSRIGFRAPILASSSRCQSAVGTARPVVLHRNISGTCQGLFAVQGFY